MTRTTAQMLAQFRTELIEGGFDESVDGNHAASEVFQLVKIYAQVDAAECPLVVGEEKSAKVTARPVVGEEKPAKVTAGPFSRDERPNSVATAYVELVPRFNAKAFEAEIDAAIARSLKFGEKP